jgi:hypothetical protein
MVTLLSLDACNNRLSLSLQTSCDWLLTNLGISNSKHLSNFSVGLFSLFWFFLAFLLLLVLLCLRSEPLFVPSILVSVADEILGNGDAVSFHDAPRTAESLIVTAKVACLVRFRAKPVFHFPILLPCFSSFGMFSRIRLLGCNSQPFSFRGFAKRSETPAGPTNTFVFWRPAFGDLA